MKLDEYLLTDSFEVFGHWWLPEEPNDKVPGTLVFSPSKGGLLRLQGRFKGQVLTGPQFALTGPAFQPKCIYGEQPDGQLLSVHRALTTELNVTASLYCHLILAGAHLGPNSPLKDVSASFAYENLEEWSCLPLYASGSRSDNDHQSHSYSFRSDVVNLLRVPKADSHPELELYGYIRHSLARNKATFERNARFRIYGLNLDNLGPLFEFTSSVGQFLTVLVGEPTALTELCIVPEPKNAINLFFQQTRSARAREILGPSMPFNLLSLANEASPLFSAWLDSYRLLHPAHAAFFSTLFSDFSFIDAKFQAIMQAIESFHRRTSQSAYVDQDEYQKIYAGLVEKIPDKVGAPLKEKLKSILKYGNEFSLKKRLKELASQLDKETLKILRIDSKFINLVVETRNFYAHLDDSIRTSLAYDSRELYQANEKLSAFFLIHLLKKLGMSEEHARAGIIKRRTFSQQ